MVHYRAQKAKEAAAKDPRALARELLLERADVGLLALAPPVVTRQKNRIK